MVRLLAAALLAAPASALATDADPGLLYPGASAMAGRSGELGVAAGLSRPGWSQEWGLGLHVQGGYAPTDRAAFTFQGVAGEAGGVMLAVGGRFRVVASDSFALAPFALITSTGPAETPVLLTGLSAEGGWAHVRLDAAIPAVVVGVEGPPALGPILGEAGLSFVAGGHRVRLGTTTLLSPTVTYRWAGEAFYVETSYAHLSWVGGAPRLFEVGGGWRF